MAQSAAAPDTLLSLAGEIFFETHRLVQRLKRDAIPEPSSLEVGATSAVWDTHSGEIETARTAIAGLTKQLMKLLDGPQGFLHEYVSSNWDHGALYTLLEFGILEKIPLEKQDGGGSSSCGVHVSELATHSGIPEDKLLCILRLNACEGIVKEVAQGVFGHTAISEQLVQDAKFRAFIGFQLFETRVASAHLADTLKRKPNEYWTGHWGKPMYDWHRDHPDKGKRFQLAMEGVSQTLDPGNSLFRDWFTKSSKTAHHLVIEVGGGDGPVSRFLAEEFPALSFQVQVQDKALITQRQQSLSPQLPGRIQFQHHDLFTPQQQQQLPEGTRLVYIIRNILWNLPDERCIQLLQTFIPVMADTANSEVVILVNDLLSPAPGTFAPHVEKAYRRRDVTLTTMHNVKQRTEAEWRALFEKASPDFRVTLTTGFTSHACRGLWELHWTGGKEIS
ncbi:hypothetical protein VTN77DRAFT_7730 [Rasamsonia byssochlamydoides]|uniref:uncharacterized protein n=1 Tax=Rasamsonia byssochlamydoides TaxID=89139 RepID=UPI0037441A0F